MIAKPIKIKVVEVYARNKIRFKQGKRGALDRPADAKRVQYCSHQRGLACAKIAGEVDLEPRSADSWQMVLDSVGKRTPQRFGHREIFERQRDRC